MLDEIKDTSEQLKTNQTDESVLVFSIVSNMLMPVLISLSYLCQLHVQASIDSIHVH